MSSGHGDAKLFARVRDHFNSHCFVHVYYTTEGETTILLLNHDLLLLNAEHSASL